MANIKSQVKRIRTNEEAPTAQPVGEVRAADLDPLFREAAAAGDKEKANELLLGASRKLDKAASKGVIHANQAANKKSALALAYNKL